MEFCSSKAVICVASGGFRWLRLALAIGRAMVKPVKRHLGEEKWLLLSAAPRRVCMSVTMLHAKQM